MGLEGGVVRLSVPAMQVKQACLTEDEVREGISMDSDQGARFGQPHEDAPHGTSGQAPGPGGRLSSGARNVC